MFDCFEDVGAGGFVLEVGEDVQFALEKFGEFRCSGRRWKKERTLVGVRREGGWFGVRALG